MECKLVGKGEVIGRNVSQCKFMGQKCVSPERLLDTEVLTPKKDMRRVTSNH